MNYWPRWINAIRKRTNKLSLMQMGAYDRLLDEYYAEEKPLPADLLEIYRVVGALTPDEQLAVQSVLQRFFVLSEDGYRNERGDEEIAVALPKIAASRENGKRGGRPRKPKPEPAGFSEGNPPATDEQPTAKHPHPHSSSPTSKNPPTPRKRGKATEPQGLRFEEFWLAWPKNERKQDRAKCWGHWRRNGLDATAEAILADVRTKRGTQKWQEGFIEAPLVYLRGKRWEDGVTPDEPKPVQQGGAAPAGGSGAPDAEATARMLAEQAARPATKPPAAVRQLLPRKAA